MVHPRHLLSLVKPRIVALLCLTGVSALYAAGGARPLTVGGFALAGALIAAGSAAANCVYDRDLDRHMERTADRPLPSGDLSVASAVAFTLALFVAGTVVGLAVLPAISVAYMWLGVAAYVGLYTIGLKRHHWLGVVLGGSAGSFPVLAGWTAVRPLEPAAFVMAALVFVWTPAHAWALAYVYRDDFRAAGVATLPAVASGNRVRQAVWASALLTVAVAALLSVSSGRGYAVAYVVGSPLFLLAYHAYWQAGTEATAVRAFFTSNLYLAVLFLAWAGNGALAQVGTTGLVVEAVLVIVLFTWLWWRRPSLRGVAAAPAPEVSLVATSIERASARLHDGRL